MWDTRENFRSVPISKIKKGKGEGTMSNVTGSLKNYFNENQDTIITICIAVIIDNYLFGGTLRTKLQGLIEGLFNSAEAKLLPKAAGATDTTAKETE